MNTTQVYTFMKNPTVILFLILILLILIVLLFSTPKTHTLHITEEQKRNNALLPVLLKQTIKK